MIAFIFSKIDDSYRNLWFEASSIIARSNAAHHAEHDRAIRAFWSGAAACMPPDIDARLTHGLISAAVARQQ